MLDEGPAVAARPAAPELDVEGVEHRGPQRADLLLADQRHDVGPRERPVRRQRAGLHLEQLEVLGQQLLDRRCGPRIALLVDLDGEPTQRLVRLDGRARPGRDDLAQVVPALGERVLTGVDDDAQRPAGELLDAALGAGPASRRRKGQVQR
ncbi:hypothetical protein I4I73_12075 [Pseudonocardia sp. KRD-184]|uniref:Uncharacterized protein n=1 Tax=Pseudonocardia oceani TaxID=2792013 RepID=A0ABS6UCE2_9PSEU|nr:hypothetical protein [Pseudonocardia oceani]MBW0090881.1 hypothetical protein [Pseudonocardia oceani]MBW0096725.1 hypothetical protein [Pseudonocardia oceani]MBW0110676.1 hypothetical protein [Pseudonocardia oceani]MBW0121747.1 hypothetical protein [Pseudonocardia oceani]MBW0129907.1 hypothetical protein [Pseudonocardia oceani]